MAKLDGLSGEQDRDVLDNGTPDLGVSDIGAW